MLKYILKSFRFFTGNDSKDRGFTLIELLVAISIFTLLSSFMVLSYHNDEKAKVLKTQAQDVLIGLQRVQNMALTGELVNGLSPLRYKFILTNCDSNCAYYLKAVLADNSELPIAQENLKSVIVDVQSASGLEVDFLPPRGKIEIINPANQDAVVLKISNSQSVSYCIKLDSVSGRMDLSATTDNCP
ncbi:MAG: prepilin-type N-terminal cleavage/methylation domain-containing protein [Candidatus Buchananbacteria bacterium]|jgi:prepilin-type N-terminal cleavage/methylation domain-containing protein